MIRLYSGIVLEVWKLKGRTFKTINIYIYTFFFFFLQMQKFLIYENEICHKCCTLCFEDWVWLLRICFNLFSLVYTSEFRWAFIGLRFYCTDVLLKQIYFEIRLTTLLHWLYFFGHYCFVLPVPIFSLGYFIES